MELTPASSGVARCAPARVDFEDLRRPADGTDAMPTDRTGLLIIRAWIEDGSSEPLRAHLRLSTDVSTGFERTVTLARPEAVCDTVQEWLNDVMKLAEGAD